MSTHRFSSPTSHTTTTASRPNSPIAPAATPHLRDNNPFTERTRYPLPIELCPFAAGMSEDKFDRTFRTPGSIMLGAFGSQPTSRGRSQYIATLTIDGTMCCTTAEATGPIQALCYILDSFDIRLDIKTFRQRKMPDNPHHQYATFLEIENRYFTHWSIGYGTTSEEASLSALIAAANQYRQHQTTLRTSASTGITYTGSLDDTKERRAA